MTVIAAILANLGSIALRELHLKSDPVDPFVVSTLVCIFGCLFNPLAILTWEANGLYKAVNYDLTLKFALGAVACSYAISCVMVNRLYYIMKASWGRVALNLQIVVTFTFDVFIADI